MMVAKRGLREECRCIFIALGVKLRVVKFWEVL